VLAADRPIFENLLHPLSGFVAHSQKRNRLLATCATVSFEQNDVDAMPVADSVSRHEFLVIMEAPRENFFQ
jgi:hypothetical protein